MNSLISREQLSLQAKHYEEQIQQTIRACQEDHDNELAEVKKALHVAQEQHWSQVTELQDALHAAQVEIAKLKIEAVELQAKANNSNSVTEDHQVDPVPLLTSTAQRSANRPG